MELDWKKLDATAFSWQKGLGSEPGYGMVVLSPRAVERLENYEPPWPIPWLYRLTESRKLYAPLFQGLTLNTVSLLCIEDCLDALKWAEDVGGLSELIRRSQNNLQVTASYLKNLPWLEFLASDERIRSSTTICLKRTHPHQHSAQEWDVILKIAQRLAELNKPLWWKICAIETGLISIDFIEVGIDVAIRVLLGGQGLALGIRRLRSGLQAQWDPPYGLILLGFDFTSGEESRLLKAELTWFLGHRHDREANFTDPWIHEGVDVLTGSLAQS